MALPYIDFDDALERFDGNAAFFKRLIAKFPQDTHFETLKTALLEGDITEAQKEAHSLKGLTGNLSLSSLYSYSIKMNELLKNGNIPEALQLLPGMQDSYDKTCAEILSL